MRREELHSSWVMQSNVKRPEENLWSFTGEWASLRPLYLAHIQLLQPSERPEDQQPSRNLQSQIGTTKESSPLCRLWAIYFSTVHTAIVGCCRGLDEKCPEYVTFVNLVPSCHCCLRDLGMWPWWRRYIITGVAFESLRLHLLTACSLSLLWVWGPRVISQLPAPDTCCHYRVP